jgi:RHS repeat-associated protein
MAGYEAEIKAKASVRGQVCSYQITYPAGFPTWKKYSGLTITDEERSEETVVAEYSYTDISGPPCSRQSTDLKIFDRIRNIQCPAGYFKDEYVVEGAWKEDCFPWNPTAPAAKNLGGAPFSGESAICPASQVEDHKGNPVSPLTGNKFQVETDFIGEGLLPLELRRYYNSLTMRSTSAVPVVYLDNLGSGWRHTYSRSLASIQGVETSTVYALRETGQTLFFEGGAGSWQITDNRPEQLSQETSGTSFVWKLRLPGGLLETYDDTGRLIDVESGGLRQTISYDVQGRLASVTDPRGRMMQFLYSTSTSVEVDKVVLPDGGVIDYSYFNSPARLSTVLYPDNKTRKYSYGSSYQTSAITGLTDESNVVYANWTYTSMNRATSSKHAGNVDLHQFSYGTGSTTVTDPRGVARSVAYQSIEGTLQRTSITGPDGDSKAYDAYGRMISQTDAVGDQTALSYNQKGLETSRTVGYGTPEAYNLTTEWNSTLLLPTANQTPALREEMDYDSDGRLTAKRKIDRASYETRTWTYTYDSQGLLTEEDGPRSDVYDTISYTYDTNGDLLSVTNALSQTTTVISRDGIGRVTQIQDPNGVTTGYTYDLRGRLLTSTTAGATTTLAYTPTGLVSTVTTPAGTVLFYTYDAAHRLTKITDGAGNYTTFNLDSSGEVTAKKVYDSGNVLRRTQSFVYNTLGQLQQIVGAQSQATTLSYDNAGSVTSEQDALGRITSYAYDALDRVTQTTDALQGYTTQGYDPAGELASVTDPISATTQYAYNGFGEVVSTTSPDSGLTTYTYDAAGNASSKTNANGVTATYGYDALNRLTSIQYPDSSLNASFGYDQGTNGIGRLTSVTDAGGVRTFAYDARGNLVQQSTTAGGFTTTIGYAYNLDGRLTQVTYPSGKVASYTRNSLGQITAIAHNGYGLLSNRTYDAAGAVKSQAWNPSGSVTEQKTYDLDGLLTNWTVGGLLSQAYSYDAVGNVTVMGGKSFGYDVMDRLVSEPTQSLSYDGNGNRLWDAAGSYGYTAASNRMATGPPGTVVLDAAGNTLQLGSQSFTYNAAGRMATATGGQAASYTYYADQLRASKTVGSVTTRYHYGPDGRLLAETDGSTGAVLREYVWDDEVPVAQASAGPIVYLHTDHLGTPRLGTNSVGAEVWRWDSDAFGTAAPTGSAVVNLRFPGQYFDAETGLHYNWHRTYDPASGRYVESDPIGLAGGLNTFGYVGGNPNGFRDPHGQFGVPGLLIGAGIGAISGAAGAMIQGGTSTEIAKSIKAGAASGAVIGLLGPGAYAVGGVGLESLVAATAGGMSNFLGQLYVTRNIGKTKYGAVLSAAIGSPLGNLASAAARGLTMWPQISAGLLGVQLDLAVNAIGNKTSQTLDEELKRARKCQQ